MPGECEICERIRSIRRGEHPLRIAELGESYAVLGDNQGRRGWCVLLLAEHVEHLDELPHARQARLFEDVARVASVIRAVFGPVRINYECLGNLAPHVHWHVIPRHADDPDPRSPVWGRPAEELRGVMSHADRVVLAERFRREIARNASP